MKTINNLLGLNVDGVEDPEARKRILALKIPYCLTDRPLRVGDMEQCKAVRNLENMAEAIVAEYEEDEEGNGPVLEFEVEVEITGSERVIVCARTKEEAIDAAEEEVKEDLMSIVDIYFDGQVISTKVKTRNIK